MPVFKDSKTAAPFVNVGLKSDESLKAAKDDHIYMDAMGFGMGNSCLQGLVLNLINYY